jgi:malate dehydrogenase
VQGLSVDEFSRERLDISERELREERDGVKDLLA